MTPFRQAQIRLTFWYAGFTGALLFAFCLTSYALLRAWLWQNLDDSLRRKDRWVCRVIAREHENWREVREELGERNLRGQGLAVVQISDGAGRLLVSLRPPPERELVPPALDGPYTIPTGALKDYRVVSERRGTFVVTVAASTVGVHTVLASVRRVFGIAVPLLLLAAAVVGWVFTSRALFPARKAYRLMQRFLADAVHELRRPLTALRGEAEVALRKPREAAEYREALQHVQAQAEVMGELVANLTLLVRADADQEAVQRQPVAFTELVAEQVDLIRPAARQQRLTLTTRLEPGVVVEGDGLRLRELVANLLDNAVKFNRPDGRVEVSLKRQTNEVALQVADTGEGISAEHLPHVCERFYRADASRRAGGSGLGLAICKWIVEAHGGRLDLHSAPGQGTRVTVSLPAPSQS